MAQTVGMSRSLVSREAVQAIAEQLKNRCLTTLAFRTARYGWRVSRFKVFEGQLQTDLLKPQSPRVAGRQRRNNREGLWLRRSRATAS